MIDLCVSLSGPHLDLLLPLFLGSMERNCNLSNVRIHLVDRGCSELIIKFCREFCEKHSAIIHYVPRTFTRSFGPSGDELENFAHDTAGICQWMLDNCGDEEVAIISHFDVVFESDTIARLQSMMGCDVGQVGEHQSGIVSYRREAIRKCGAKFDNLDGLRACKDGEVIRLRFAGDSRCNESATYITGLDVGEWISLHLAMNGWRVIVPEEVGIRHLRCGSGYHGDVTASATRNNALGFLSDMNIKPIV